MPKLRLTGRKAVLLGVSTAAATAAVVAVAAPAAAAQSQLTSCSDTVRVRSQPNETAQVIGSCQAGERVTVDGTRNGFAHLVNKRGWASLDYVRLRDSNSSSNSDDNSSDYSDNRSDYSDSDSNNDSDSDYNNDDRDYNRDYDRDYNRHRRYYDDNNNDDKLLGGLFGN